MGIFNRHQPPHEPPAVVDLRPAPQRIGEPRSCPECGHPGFLDRLDVVEEVQYEHCRTCMHEWATPFSELAERA